MSMKKNIYNGIIGLIVADAVGVPVEFKARDTYEINDMIGYGTHQQPPGTWSDDSSMTLATVESIGRLGKVDPTDIMRNFVKWYCGALFTPHGITFDVGGTTRKAISNFYLHNLPVKDCGGKNKMDNGNGALMRILPVAFIPTKTFEKKLANTMMVAMLTHNHPISHIGCLIYVLTAENLMNGIDKKEAFSNAVQVIGKYYEHTEAWQEYRFLPEIWKYDRDEIKSSGYVVDTLEAAIWCFMNTCTYKDCVLLAANLGEDTDTVAAVAGGLAGIYYGCGGEEGIPAEWISQIARYDWICELINKFESELSK